MKVEAFGTTDVGKVRNHNEDSFVVRVVGDAPMGANALLIVADGMGGHAAGEVASRMAIENFVTACDAATSDADELGDDDYLDLLSDLLKRVNGLVWEAGQVPGQIGMGTTFTGMVIRRERLFVIHVGDSRGYLFTGGVLRQITTDHSLVEEWVQLGILTTEEARVHPNRNVITRAVGLDPEVSVDQAVVDIKSGDRLLLCTDGLNSLVLDSEIESIVSNGELEETAQSLIDTANHCGGDDNTTIILASLAF